MLEMRVLVTALVTTSLAGACERSHERPAPPAVRPPSVAAAAAAPAPVAPTIKLGQVMPYSGPAATYGNIGRLQAAYFEMVNRRGGIRGRAIDLLSLDDGYDPPRALAQVKFLVEEQRVLAIFNPVGTASNIAIQPYLNANKVPQLFVSSGASRWADPLRFPWTIGFNPSYRLEGKTYAAHLLATKPRAKIGVLAQADDFGNDLRAGFREGLGDQVGRIVVEATYQTSEPSVSAQITKLREAGADAVVLIATPKFAIQAIRQIDESGWRPVRYLANVSSSIGTVLTQAGLGRAEGLITVQYMKDPTDKRWADDPGMREWTAFMRDHYPQGDTRDGLNAYAYVAAQTLVKVLERCGDDFSPTNLMAQAASLHDFTPGLLLPGIRINTSPTDYEPFDALQLTHFDGNSWVFDEPLVSPEAREEKQRMANRPLGRRGRETAPK